MFRRKKLIIVVHYRGTVQTHVLPRKHWKSKDNSFKVGSRVIKVYFT